MRISSQDKPWVTAEIKYLDRLKNREYTKKGKSLKYKQLAKQFKEKYEMEAKKYLRKNMDELMDCKPGQANSVLKKMGTQPGDCIDSNTFTLPGHESENLSDQESAERIADYFAQISQEFPPLDRKLLPLCVQQNLDSQSSLPPIIDSHDVYQKIKAVEKTQVWCTW